MLPLTLREGVLIARHSLPHALVGYRLAKGVDLTLTLTALQAFMVLNRSASWPLRCDAATFDALHTWAYSRLRLTTMRT